MRLGGAAATSGERGPGAVRGAGRDTVDVRRVVEAGGEGAVVELSVVDATLQSILTDHGGELLALSVDEHLATVTVEVGQENLAQSFVDAVDAAFERVELASYRRREHRAETQRGFVADLRAELTDRQYAALARAYTAGYFEWPHDTTGEEIAEAMGIGRSTFHQHLRAAQRKLAGAIIDSRDRVGGADAPSIGLDGTERARSGWEAVRPFTRRTSGTGTVDSM